MIYLTIDKSLHLEKKLQRLEGETDQEIARLKWQEGQHEEIARQQAQRLKEQETRIKSLEGWLRTAGLMGSRDQRLIETMIAVPATQVEIAQT